MTNNLMIKPNGEIVINNVTYFQASRNVSHYIVMLSFRDIVNSLKIVKYDAEAQRRLKDGKPFIKEQQLKVFKENLKNGDDIMGNLIWNLRTDDILNKKFKYNRKTKQLIISKDQLIFITDGYHRTIACKELFEENEYAVAQHSNFLLHIHFIDKKKEKDRFGKINHNTNQVSHTKRKRTLDDIQSQFVEDVIQYSWLDGRVEKEIDSVTQGKFCTYNQLYNAMFRKYYIKRNDLLNQESYNNLLNKLVQFFDNLIKIKKEFGYRSKEDLKSYKEKTLILEPIFLFSYIYVFKEIKDYDNEIQLQILKEFFNSTVYCGGKKVKIFDLKKNSDGNITNEYWVGRLFYKNGKAISGYAPQTALNDATRNALDKILPKIIHAKS